MKNWKDLTIEQPETKGEYECLTADGKRFDAIFWIDKNNGWRWQSIQGNLTPRYYRPKKL